MFSTKDIAEFHVSCIIVYNPVFCFAGDVLEIGALWSILKKDIPSFERYMAQLKCYYFDYK